MSSPESTVPGSSALLQQRQLQEEARAYNGLVDIAVRNNPQLTAQKACDRIFGINREQIETLLYYYESFQGSNTRQSSIVGTDLHWLSFLEEAGELENIERERLADLHEQRDRIARWVVKKRNCDLQEARNLIKGALMKGSADNFSEAEDIMRNGPIVEGFDNTDDPHIPNDKVRKFLVDTFTLGTLFNAKVGRVIKSDEIGIFIGRSDTDKGRGNWLFNEGIAYFHPGFSDVMFPQGPDKISNYLKAMRFLEGADSEDDKLMHIYKVRAVGGHRNVFDCIGLWSFSVEEPSDFDYLDSVQLEVDDKMRVYILGTLAHEIAHRIEFYERDNGEGAMFKKYREIVEQSTEERGDDGYVSDYMRRHRRVYNSKGHYLLGDDFAETIRIYVTNADYLRERYPRRYDFVIEHFPYIKENAAVEAMRSLPISI